MLSADEVLEMIAANPAVMGMLDSGPCTLEHVTERVADGPDERRDACPCDRSAPAPDPRTDDPNERLRELGGGHYVSSERHTIGDLVRDAVGPQVDPD